MIKTLRPVGNSLGLIIDRPILELLGIDRQTQLRVRTDGKVLSLNPSRRDGPDDTRPSAGRKSSPGEKSPKRPGGKRSQ